MEMTFPHHALRQESVDDRKDYRALISVVAARQANSRTVRALRRAESSLSATGSDADQRVHYFARPDSSRLAVRGAFWQPMTVNQNCEPDVYQAGSTNIKVQLLEDQSTGEQLNRAGHGASRKL